MSAHIWTHSSQMNTSLGPPMRPTSSWVFPQNEHFGFAI